MPPRSAVEDQQASIDSFSHHSCSGGSAIRLAPKPLTEENVQRARKTVSFSSKVHVRATLHINEYTNEEIHATWFNAGEFETIKKDVKFALDLFQAGLLDEDSESYCRRGLEYRTKIGMRRRMMNKELARSVVLDEQERQWTFGLDDAAEIARIYIAAAQHCYKSALETAFQDFEDARSI